MTLMNKLSAAIAVVALGLSTLPAKTKASTVQPIVVVALAKVKPEEVSNFKKVVFEILEPTRKEDGNISYVFHQSTERPNEFAFYEEWDSNQQLDRHLKAPHMTRFFEKVGSFFEPSYPQIMRFKKINH